MTSITRRALVANAAMLGAGALLPVRAAAARSLPYPPGVQLWTVKDEVARDLDGTLRALAGLGYRRIEAAGWQGRTARQFRSAVQGAGLQCVAAHHGLKDLIANTDELLGFAREVGVRYLVASSPAPARPMDEKKEWNAALAEAMTLDSWRGNAEAMNRIGRRARALGMRFGYHNHAPEFMAYERRLPMDEIVRLTDPADVVLELDIGWVAAAGYDPAEAIRRYRDRIHLLHVKDVATAARVPGRIADDTRSTVIGAGTVDWASVFRAARQTPLHSYFVEQEEPFAEPPLTALAKSIAFLQRLSV
jgi:sugar phosphate isomerase/epimerase